MPCAGPGPTNGIVQKNTLRGCWMNDRTADNPVVLMRFVDHFAPLQQRLMLLGGAVTTVFSTRPRTQRPRQTKDVDVGMDLINLRKILRAAQGPAAFFAAGAFANVPTDHPGLVPVRNRWLQPCWLALRLSGSGRKTLPAAVQLIFAVTNSALPAATTTCAIQAPR